MQDYFSHDPGADAINRTRAAVADVKNIMIENIEKVGAGRDSCMQQLSSCSTLLRSANRQLQLGRPLTARTLSHGLPQHACEKEQCIACMVMKIYNHLMEDTCNLRE